MPLGKIALSVFILLLLFGCGGNKPIDKKDEERSVTVIIQKLERGFLRKYIELSGTLMAKDEVKVYSDVPGKLESISVKVGDFVQFDDEIASVDRSQIGAKFKPAIVKSPIEGYVTAVYGIVGQLVAPSVPLANIANIYTLDLALNIPESYIRYVNIGSTVTFSLPAIPNAVFDSQVYYKDLSVDSVSHTLLFKGNVNNPNGKLLPGMYADIKILINSAYNIFVLPNSAVFKKDDKSYVYINSISNVTKQLPIYKEKNIIDHILGFFTGNTNREILDTVTTNYTLNISELREVKVLFEYKDDVAIGGGLSDSDEIVVFGREFLKEGTIINPIKEGQE